MPHWFQATELAGPAVTARRAARARTHARWAEPADHRRDAEVTLHHRALALREQRLSAVRPGKDLGAVVGGEDDDGVVVHAHISLSFCITMPRSSSSHAMPASWMANRSWSFAIFCIFPISG